MITTIPDGQIVTEPGAYRMSMAHYHSQCTPGVSVSSTGIRAAALQSPMAFWKTSDLNPNRYPKKEESDSLILGKAAHCLILGDEVYADHFISLPEVAPRRPTSVQIEAFKRDGKWSAAAAEGAAFWAEWDAKAAGRAFLTAEQVMRIAYMAENLNALPEAREALVGELTEVSLIWQDEQTGLWVKSRPDCIPQFSKCDIGDLKTMAPKRTDLWSAVMAATEDRAYDVQLAVMAAGIAAVFGETVERCALIFTQTTEPYEAIPLEVADEALAFGKDMMRLGLNRIARGMRDGVWPGMATGMRRYSLSNRSLAKWDEAKASGELLAEYPEHRKEPLYGEPIND
jgi:hypothetical protein